MADLLGKVAEGIAVEGMESLAPALVDGMESLLDVLPPGCQVVVSDPERVRTRAHDLVATSAEFLQASWVNAAAGNAVPVDLEPLLGTASYWTLAHGCASTPPGAALPWWTIGAVRRRRRAAGRDATDAWTCARSESYRGETERAVADLARLARATAGGSWSSPRATAWPSAWSSCSASTSGRPARGARPGRRAGRGVVHALTGSLGRGFLAAGHQAGRADRGRPHRFDRRPRTKDMRKMPSRRRNAIDPLQLRPGDFVVHEQHGVGRFVRWPSAPCRAPPASTS